MRGRHYLPVVLFSLWIAGTYAQSQKIAILKKAVIDAGTAPARLTAIFALCEQATESLHKDTLMAYALKADALAKAAASLSDERRSAYYMAYAYYRMTKTDSALLLINSHAPIVNRDARGSALDISFRLLKARCRIRQQEYKEPLAEYYSILSEAEQRRDTLNIARSMNGVGTILNRTGDKKGALEWFLKAIRIVQRPLYRDQVIFAYTNAAVLFNTLGQYDSATAYVTKAVTLARAAENLADLTNSLGMYAGNMMDMQRFDEAEKALQEAIIVSEKIGDPNDIISHMGALAVFYYDRNEPRKGIDVGKKAIEEINRFGLINKLPFIYDVLAQNYQLAGDYKTAGETLRLLTDIKDTLYERNSAESLAEMKTRFEVQEKENTIIRQELKLVRKDFLIYSALGLLLLAIVSGYLIFRQYKKRQRLKAAVAVSAAEESERKRIAADLHDNLGAYAASIASNVGRLSARDTGDSGALQAVRENSQAIVSDLGDTIWALKKESLSLTAVSDRLKVFIQRVQPAYPDITIDTQEDITHDHLLSPSQGFHLFQSLREAVNNALKHSGGKHIIIVVTGSEKEWRISVSDDGTGMEVVKQGCEEGNGLFNMKNRAQQAGWNVNWSNGKPGTMVTISQVLA